MSSFKAEVIADDSGKWVSNLLRFAAEHEALAYANDLHWNWTAVRQTRVVPSTDQANARWVDNRLDLLPAEERLA